MASKKKRKQREQRRAEKKRQTTRRYQAAQNNRLSFAASSSSADAELINGLRALRDRSRELVRNNVYARRAKSITVNNVIGKGVGLQGQVKRAQGNKLLTTANAAIERAWRAWSLATNCHLGGALHFADIERLAMGEIFEAGEIFIRTRVMRLGDSRVPLALELIEAERVADDHEITPTAGGEVTLGIERDETGRPLVYYFHKRHPQDYRRGPYSDSVVAVPASEVIHLRIVDRWPQARGVPMMHAAILRINQHGEFEDAALIAARIGASKVGFYEQEEWAQNEDMGDGKEADGTSNAKIEPGQFFQLPPGYRFTPFDPTYPTEAFDPFTRASLRGIAAGVGVSYESISRDYSQSNYSSSRLALLDDRDTWQTLQAWWIRTFREPLHRMWLQQAVIAGAIPEIDRVAYLSDIERFSAVRFKPRGWTWIDPAKEVRAYKEAERAGYITKSDVIAATAGGADLEDVITARRNELDALEDAGLVTDTTNAAELSDDQGDDQAGDQAGDLADDQGDDQGDDQAGRVHLVGKPKPAGPANQKIGPR